MISAEDAVAIARRRAADKGWPWTPDVVVAHRKPWLRGAGRYEVETDPRLRGTRLRFVIDAGSGAVLDEGFIPR